MASVTASTINKRRRRRRPPRPWTARWTLTWRILAVNIFAVLILALGVVYLDAFRNKLSKERVQRTVREAEISAIIARSVPPEQRARAIAAIGESTRSRIRLYGPDGRLVGLAAPAATPGFLHASVVLS